MTLTFREITSSEEATCPWYRRFPPLGTLLPHGLVESISPYSHKRKGRNGPPRRVCRGTVYVPPLEKLRQGCPWRDSLEAQGPFTLSKIMRCRKHGARDLDCWYDCEQCLNESFRWAQRNAFTHCVSPYVKCPGSDGGEWVRKNASRWVNTDAPAAGGSSDPGAFPRPDGSCPLRCRELP